MGLFVLFCMYVCGLFMFLFVCLFVYQKYNAFLNPVYNHQMYSWNKK